MSQHTPPERKLQPLPAWMLKEEEQTGGNAGAGGEQTPSLAQPQEPEHTARALPESTARVPSPKPLVVSREEGQPSALGEDEYVQPVISAISHSEEGQPSARGKDVLRRVVVGAILGALIGAVIGYINDQSALAAVAGATIGAMVLGVTALAPRAVGEFLLGVIADGCVDGCFSFFVFSGACIITLGGLLLWHSLALVAFAGVGVIPLLCIVLPAGARSYKDASAVQ